MTKKVYTVVETSTPDDWPTRPGVVEGDTNTTNLPELGKVQADSKDDAIQQARTQFDNGRNKR